VLGFGILVLVLVVIVRYWLVLVDLMDVAS